MTSATTQVRADVDDISNDVSERVEVRDLKQRRMRENPDEQRHVEACGAHDQRNKAFKWRVGARTVSDGVEAFTSV